MQNVVFLLLHDHRLGEGEANGKLLGLFASQDEAKRAIERYRQLPGFDVAPDDFQIHALKIGYYAWSGGFDPCSACDDVQEYARLAGATRSISDFAHLVQHEYEFPAGVDQTRLIGAFANRNDAKRAIRALKKIPGFSDYKREFYVAKCFVGHESWDEGYITVYPDEFDD